MESIFRILSRQPQIEIITPINTPEVKFDVVQYTMDKPLLYILVGREHKLLSMEPPRYSQVGYEILSSSEVQRGETGYKELTGDILKVRLATTPAPEAPAGHDPQDCIGTTLFSYINKEGGEEEIAVNVMTDGSTKTPKDIVTIESGIVLRKNNSRGLSELICRTTLETVTRQLLTTGNFIPHDLLVNIKNMRENIESAGSTLKLSIIRAKKGEAKVHHYAFSQSFDLGQMRIRKGNGDFRFIDSFGTTMTNFFPENFSVDELLMNSNQEVFEFCKGEKLEDICDGIVKQDPDDLSCITTEFK